MPKATYNAIVSDKAGHLIQRSFEHPCPDVLCGSDPPVQQVDKCSRILCRVHTDELLAAAPFSCQICGEPAKELIHTPRFYPRPSSPVVMDINVQPVCHKEKCGILARQSDLDLRKQRTKRCCGQAALQSGYAKSVANRGCSNVQDAE